MKKNSITNYLTITGLFAAMITLMTAYIFHIPYGANGGYIHFGDALIYTAAILLPKPYAIAAAAIGGGLADLMTAPMWMPATVIIKTLIVLPFTNNGSKIINTRNIIAPVVATLITIVGYYIAEGILFGSFIAPVASIYGNIIQGIGSAVVFFIIVTSLDKIHIKKIAS